MITRKKALSLMLVALWALLLSLPANLTHSRTALASTKLDGYSLTIPGTAITYQYSSGGPQVPVTLVVPPGSTDPRPWPEAFSLTLDGNKLPNSLIVTTAYLVYTLPALSVGQHTVQVFFTAHCMQLQLQVIRSYTLSQKIPEQA